MILLRCGHGRGFKARCFSVGARGEGFRSHIFFVCILEISGFSERPRVAPVAMFRTNSLEDFACVHGCIAPPLSCACMTTGVLAVNTNKLVLSQSVIALSRLFDIFRLKRNRQKANRAMHTTLKLKQEHQTLMEQSELLQEKLREQEAIIDRTKNHSKRTNIHEKLKAKMDAKQHAVHASSSLSSPSSGRHDGRCYVFLKCYSYVLLCFVLNPTYRCHGYIVLKVTNNKGSVSSLKDNNHL